MSNVWKRLQRVGKKAAKFNYKSYSHLLTIQCNAKWQPNKVIIVFQHRDRKKYSRVVKWEPSNLRNIYEGVCKWNENDVIDFDVTLYKGNNDDKYERKEWSILIEDEDSKGKKRILATGSFRVDLYAKSLNENEINVNLKLQTEKIQKATLKFLLITQFLREGKATDDDMISLQSYASNASGTLMRQTSFRRKLHDFDENDDDNASSSSGPGGGGGDEDDIDFNVIQELENSKINLKRTLLQDSTNIVTKKTPNKTSQVNTSNKLNNSSTIVSDENVNKLPKIELSKQISHVSFDSLHFETVNVINKNPFGTDGDDNDDDNVEIDENNPFFEGVNDKSNPFYNDNQKNISKNENSFLEQFEKEVNSNNTPSKISQNNDNTDSATTDNLLIWCKNITKNYKNVNIINFSSSWKDGLAFCAIIHYFRPDLIDFKSLKSNDTLNNCKLAFKLTDLENIPRIIQLADMIQREIPDKLAIMTYVYQLKEHFERQSKPSISTITKQTTPVKNDKQQSQESTNSKIENKNKTKVLNTPFMKAFSLIASTSDNKQNTNNADGSFTASTPKAIDNKTTTTTTLPSTVKVMSNNNNKNQQSPVKPVLYESHKQYTNPFDSDSDDDNKSAIITTTSTSPKTTDANVYSGIVEIKQNGKVFDIIDTDANNDDSNNSSNTNTIRTKRSLSNQQNSSNNKNDELKQRARQLIQQTKQTSSLLLNNNTSQTTATTTHYEDFNSLTSSSASSSLTTQSPNTQQYSKNENVQIARQMIADARRRRGSKIRKFKSMEGATELSSLDSSVSSPYDSLTNKLSSMSLDTKLVKTQAVIDQLNENDKINTIKSSPKSPSSINNNNNNNASNVSLLIGNDYVTEEIAMIEKEQLELDEKAIVLEKNLRKIMKNDSDKKQEDNYIKEWFLLVNKKNSLIHRQMELEMLQKEHNLQKRFDLLNKELYNLMQIDDSKKSEEQRRNEKNLLNELVSLVDQRNEIVVQLDEENRYLESEQEINDLIQQRSYFSGKNDDSKTTCILQ